MTPWRRILGLALVTLIASCGEPNSDRSTSAPTVPHATAVLRPGKIRIADRVEIDIRVTSPPGHRVLRLEPPESLAGFELLDWRRLQPMHEPGLWLHPYRAQLRAIDTGRFEWPALHVTLAAEDDARIQLELPAIALEVDSILGEHPDRATPFGARAAPEPPPEERLPLRPFALAVTSLALASAALLFLARRRARKLRPRAEPAPAPWSAAQGEFDRAAELSDNPAAASHRAANALRHYMSGRFGARTRMHTSEELAGIEPPFGASSSWPTFVALLHEFDSLRFRPAGSEASDSRSAAFASTLARARDFVEATTPPAGLQ